MPPTQVQKNAEDQAFIKHNFEVIHKELSQVKDCLLGNDFNEGKGLVSQFNELTKRIDTLEDMFNKYRNILIGLALGTGVGCAAVIKAIVDAFTKN